MPDGSACSHPDSGSGKCQWHEPDREIPPDELPGLLSALISIGGTLTGFELARSNLEQFDFHAPGKPSLDMRNSNLHHSRLAHAHLYRADLRGASLLKADLSHANLNACRLENVNLLGANLHKTKLEHVDWGMGIQQDIAAQQCPDRVRKKALLEEAEETYRMLRQEAEHRGQFENAGFFFRKEMRMRRLQKPLWSVARGISKTVDLLCGYGESPFRIILFSLFVIIGFALGYSVIGIHDNGRLLQVWQAQGWSEILEVLANCLYYSVVTFTTLGYGDIVPQGWARLLAGMEAFIGAFSIALFVVVFMKKMTR